MPSDTPTPREPERHSPLIPRPPTTSNAVDYVVIIFVLIVASMLLLSTMSLVVLSLVQPDEDRSTLVNALTDILTTIIGALIGFIAGKGAGKSEAHDEQVEREDRQRADDAP